MEVKCFVIFNDLLLPLGVNFSYFEIQIFMLLKLESESAIQKICNRIRIRRILPSLINLMPGEHYKKVFGFKLFYYNFKSSNFHKINLLLFLFQADLNPLFNWNVKQLFLYLTAEYETPNNKLNQVPKKICNFTYSY